MSLSLKKEKMVEFLSSMAGTADFRCMLWGVMISSSESGAVSIASDFLPAGAAKALANSFCYMGCTNDSIYFTTVNSMDTSKPLGFFRIPFASVKKLKVRKSPFSGTRTVEIDSAPYGGEPDDSAWFIFQIKMTSIGTNIKDQKENALRFLQILENDCKAKGGAV